MPQYILAYNFKHIKIVEHIMFFNVFPAHDQCFVQILTEYQKKVIDDETLKLPYKTMAELKSVASDTSKNAEKV